MIPFSLPGTGGLHIKWALSAVTRKVRGLAGTLDGAKGGEFLCTKIPNRKPIILHQYYVAVYNVTNQLLASQL